MALSRCLQVLGTFFFPSRKTPFLQRLRSRLRHAWLLHFWLISALLLMPVPRLARADEEEEIFDQVPNESRVVVTVSATDGTTGMLPAMNRPVLVHAELTSREVWIGRLSRRIFYGIPQTGPLMGSGITFSASEDGSVWGSSPSTDSSGNGYATFTMGMKASTVEVTVEGYGATGSITFEAPVETWHWDHDESLLSASFAVEGSVRGVPLGATRQVRADTVFGNWSILVSDFNPAKTKKVRTGNSNTSPAIGAEISWSIISGDGGVVPAESPSYTSGSGDAAATFTMGAVASVMRADVAYNNGSTTYATITFDPGDMQWTKTGDETTISTTLSTADAVTTFPEGEARWVTAQLVFNSSEVWVDELGNTENRNPTSGAASGAPVTFYVDSGDGTVSNAAGSTVPSVTGTSDADGFVSVLFTMGSQGFQGRGKCKLFHRGSGRAAGFHFRCH